MGNKKRSKWKRLDATVPTLEEEEFCGVLAGIVKRLTGEDKRKQEETGRKKRSR